MILHWLPGSTTVFDIILKQAKLNILCINMRQLDLRKIFKLKNRAKCEDPPIWVSQLQTDIHLLKFMKTNEMQQGQNV